MSYRVRKTLVIGLGGTGLRSVQRMKEKYHEVYGTDNIPTTEFLVFDTADKKPLPTANGQDIELQPNEFQKLETTDPKKIVRVNSEVQDWFPGEGVPLHTANGPGANQVRAIGRLKLFQNASDVHSRIKQAFDSLRAIKPKHDLGEFDLNDRADILISVVGSLAGGTGSGTFLDIAFVCRKFMNAADTLVGYLLLPDVFTSKPSTHNIRPNAYGALKELDMLMSRSSMANGSYQFGGQRITRQDAPFNIVYLINNKQKEKYTYTEVEEMTELLGMGVFIASGGIGQDAAEIWNNLDTHIGSLPSFKGKKALYSSYGVSELVLDVDDAAQEMAYETAIQMIEHAFLGMNADDITDHVDEFIDRHRLCEHEADQVIDELLPPGRYRRFNLPDDLDRNNIEDQFDRRSSHVSNAEAQARQTCAQNVAPLEQEKIEALHTHIKDRVSEPNGLRYAQAFLDTFITKLEGYQTEMEEERNEFQKQRRGTDGRFKAIKEDFDQAQSKYFGYGRWNLMKEAAENLKALVNEESERAAEMARRSEAASLFQALISEARELHDDLETLSQRLETIRSQLTQRLESLRSSHSTPRPFTIEIRPSEQAMETDGSESAQAFLRWLNGRDETVMELADMQTEDLENHVLEFAREQPALQRISEMHIEDVLSDLPDGELTDLIDKLDRTAVPLWNYEDAYTAGQRETETFYLFGVPNTSETFLSADRLGTMLQSAHEPQLTSTADRHRLFCYKVEAAIPAFTVRGLGTYKMRYENPDAPFTYHVDEQWEEEAPDLEPAAEEQGLREWSLANADPFNLVSKKGTHYYAISEEQGSVTDDYEIKLDQGRQNALDTFCKRDDLIDEMDQEIDRITRQKGSGATAEALRQYVEDLLDKSTSNSSTQQLIEKEVNEIERYVDEITSL
jgi:hypothetical protein